MASRGLPLSPFRQSEIVAVQDAHSRAMEEDSLLEHSDSSKGIPNETHSSDNELMWTEWHGIRNGICTAIAEF